MYIAVFLVTLMWMCVTCRTQTTWHQNFINFSARKFVWDNNLLNNNLLPRQPDTLKLNLLLQSVAHANLLYNRYNVGYCIDRPGFLTGLTSKDEVKS